jgi:hypothetical protein
MAAARPLLGWLSGSGGDLAPIDLMAMIVQRIGAVAILLLALTHAELGTMYPFAWPTATVQPDGRYAELTSEPSVFLAETNPRPAKERGGIVQPHEERLTGEQAGLRIAAIRDIYDRGYITLENFETMKREIEARVLQTK